METFHSLGYEAQKIAHGQGNAGSPIAKLSRIIERLCEECEKLGDEVEKARREARAARKRSQE